MMAARCLLKKQWPVTMPAACAGGLSVCLPCSSWARCGGEVADPGRQRTFSTSATLFTSAEYPYNSSAAFINRKGVREMDPKMPLSELLREAPAYFKQNFHQLAKEVKHAVFEQDNLALYHEDVLARYQRDALKVEFRFETPTDFEKWQTGCDSDWNEGLSSCELVPTNNHTALFRGKLDSTPPKDGKNARAGWATMKLNAERSFGRRAQFSWDNFTHLVIKCRGDGRSYKLNLSTAGYYDLTWGNLYSFPLHTHGGPYWQIAKIPFSKTIMNVYGRIQDTQTRVPINGISSVGIAIMDKLDGEFSLEVDWVGVLHDQAHFEQHAYEGYSVPVLTTKGM